MSKRICFYGECMPIPDPGVVVRDEINVLHHSGHGKVYCSGDGAVTGMTLMCAAILTVEQIGVDGDSSVTDVQKEKFIGQREKFLLVFL